LIDVQKGEEKMTVAFEKIFVYGTLWYYKTTKEEKELQLPKKATFHFQFGFHSF